MVLSQFFGFPSQKMSFYNSEMGNGRSLCNFACDDIIIKNSLLDIFLGLVIDNNLDLSDCILIYEKLQMKNRILYSEY